jgi:hypothetical protein
MFDDEQQEQTGQAQNHSSGSNNGDHPLGIGGNPAFGGPSGNTTASDNNTPVSGSTDSPLPAPGGSTSQSPKYLEEIKGQALAQLSPLVDKLDQTPEEKYKTLMMVIQASDNQELISEAYKAAQNIADEKVKAEALLNIINEINYFTQPRQ